MGGEWVREVREVEDDPSKDNLSLMSSVLLSRALRKELFSELLLFVRTYDTILFRLCLCYNEKAEPKFIISNLRSVSIKFPANLRNDHRQKFYRYRCSVGRFEVES